MSRNADGQEAQKKWCAMVYFAADDDLLPYALADLEQMKSAGSTDEVDLLAEVNSGGNRPIKRYYLQKGTYLEEDRIVQRDENNKERALRSTGKADQDLIDFIEWCGRVSAAENYMLVLWGHGQGWKADDPNPCKVPGAGNPRRLVPREEVTSLTPDRLEASFILPIPPLLPNDDGAEYLTIQSLESALKTGTDKLGKKIAVLGMDACLMAMAEVAFQVGDSADYLVASEDIVPDESWPYNAILDLLVRYPDLMTPVDLGRTIVWKFTFGFGQQKKYVTQSICNVGRGEGMPANNLTAAVKQLVDVLLGRAGKADSDLSQPEVRWATMIARGEVQSFHITEYVDLYDFCRLLALNCEAAPLVNACEAVMESIAGKKASGDQKPKEAVSAEASSQSPIENSDPFVVDFGTYGQSLLWSNGVSVYFPSTGPVPACYAELAFCVETKWHEFLESFLTSPSGRQAIALVPIEQKDLTPAAKAGPAGEATAVVAPNTGAPAAPIITGPNKTVLNDTIKSTRDDPIKEPEPPFWHVPSGSGLPKRPTESVGGRQRQSNYPGTQGS